MSRPHWSKISYHRSESVEEHLLALKNDFTAIDESLKDSESTTLLVMLGRLIFEGIL